ncbi:MAG: methionine--tRNA ligase [Candidatus Marsarchaeota archaeon]|nr:methionine--tRNA ligase [Candidatus Marsarchaeota archaeon]MCL5413063.1 methionine--tRNA ligase [Candidatus Marsarchaeota archaeon]
MEDFYITTAIPYVNARPHIGFALECVQADVIARHRRISGERVYLTTGTDENSLKNVIAAEKAGMKTKDFCAANSALFRELADRIGLSYDAFIETASDPDHRKVAETLWRACSKSGDIYMKKYSGLYCVGCELFYKESELVGGLCPEHRTKPEIVEEENYFFRLSKYGGRLLEALDKEITIIPDSRKSEITNFIKEGLEDFSISRSIKRSRGWGIPVPGDSSQTIYVWFDALGAYLSGAGLPSDMKKFNSLWPADMHVIGKGVVRFHAIYWPAMLMSAGIPLPKSIFIHGYVTVNGQKMSKSIGNVVDPVQMLEKYGMDPVRYYLTRSISTFQDGDFSEKAVKEATNSELVGNLGNFVNRTLTFISSVMGGSVDEQDLGEGKLLLDEVYKIVDEVERLMRQGQLNAAILRIMEISSLGNRYFQDNEPWKLAKEDAAAAKEVLFVCANLCRILGILIYPYMPETSNRILKYIGEEPTRLSGAKSLKKHFEIAAPNILFRKIE